jgi:hypothetical protein
MRLTQIQPVREGNHLVGWTARFADDAGLVRIANLGLGALMDPSSFSSAVARQGVPYISPCGSDREAWRAFVQSLTVHPPKAVPQAARQR